ncbi:MAG: NUDIX hydrolase [Frankia sp.]
MTASDAAGDTTVPDSAGDTTVPDSSGDIAVPDSSGATVVTVDVVLLTLRAGRLSVLLTREDDTARASDWRLPGRRVRPEEDLEDAARAALEATGVAAAGHLEQLRTYGHPGRDPERRAVSIAYLALLPNLPRPRGDGRDGVAARWWPVEDLTPRLGNDPAGSPDAPALALDHDEIVGDGVERARAKLEYSPLAAAFVDEPFTLADLRRVYEAAWGAPLDPPNFRRKVLSTSGFVVPVGARAAPRGGGRPAELYRRGEATALHPPLLRRTV